MYDKNQAYMNLPAGVEWLFTIISGVLQGCPLSGTLFVIGIDPLLYAFEQHIHTPGLGCVRACADDIGVSLNQLSDLRPLFVLFDKFRKLSGLVLKPSKCICILLFSIANEVNTNIVRKHISRICNQLEGMDIVNVAKYLGIMMGPHSSKRQWNAASRKFMARVADIHSLKPPPAIASIQYSTRAISVLGYIAQLVPPPKSLKNSCLNAVVSILNLPGRVFDPDTAHSLEKFGGPQIVDAPAYLKACLIRASHKMFINPELQCKLLQDAAIESQVFCHYFAGEAREGIITTRPEGWDSQAFCYYTARARTNFPLHNFSKSSKTSFQRQAYDLVRSNGLPWTRIIRKRLIMWHTFVSDIEDWSSSNGSASSSSSSSSNPSDPDLDSSIPMIDMAIVDAAAAAAKNLSPGTKMCYVKTLVNGWATSRRCHAANVRTCIFGCKKSMDDTRHYLVCPILWPLACSIMRLTLAESLDLFGRDISRKLSLPVPSEAKVKAIAFAYRWYHFLKHQHLEEIHLLKRERNLERIVEVVLEAGLAVWRHNRD